MNTPGRIRQLPFDKDRGYYIPWFVPFIDGKPEFRVAGPDKRVRAVNEDRCWVCGQTLGRYKTFVVGPMCVVNKTSADPPSHTDCATYSAIICPYLVKPQMVRRDKGKPENVSMDGEGIMRNPGVCVLWTTKEYEVFTDSKGGFLFDIGDCHEFKWMREGREATREEVLASVETGCPILRAEAEKDGPADLAAFDKAKEYALEHYMPI